MLARMGQHQELGQEIEIGQAARRELEIPRIALALLLRDQAPHRRHSFCDRRGIAPPRQDRADRGFGARRQIGIAGHDARARQRHLLPELGLSGVIGLEAGKLRRGRALSARRAQPHVDLVERAPSRRHRQRSHQPLGEADMPGHRIEAFSAVAGVRILRAVVEQDQVEVGGRRQFARAEPSQSQHHGPRPRDDAMVGSEGRARILESDAQAALRDGAPGLPGAARGVDARKQPRADQEILLPGRVAQAVEPVLDAGRRCPHRRADPARQGRGIDRRDREGGIDDAVEHMGMHRGDPG